MASGTSDTIHEQAHQNDIPVPNPTMTTITLHDNDVLVLRHFPPKQAEAIARAISATDRKNVVVLLFDDNATLEALDVHTMATLGWVKAGVSAQ